MFNREIPCREKKDLDKSFLKIIELSFATVRLMCIYVFCHGEILSQCRGIRMGRCDIPKWLARMLDRDRTKGNGLKLRWVDVD